MDAFEKQQSSSTYLYRLSEDVRAYVRGDLRSGPECDRVIDELGLRDLVNKNPGMYPNLNQDFILGAHKVSIRIAALADLLDPVRHRGFNVWLQDRAKDSGDEGNLKSLRAMASLAAWDSRNDPYGLDILKRCLTAEKNSEKERIVRQSQDDYEAWELLTGHAVFVGGQDAVIRHYEWLIAYDDEGR